MAAVGVIFGGPSPEHDISILTGLQAVAALKDHFEVVAIYWSKLGEFLNVSLTLEPSDFTQDMSKKSTELTFKISDTGGFFETATKLTKREKKIEFESLINCCHGGPGESGALQGALDICRINYTGPSLSYALLGMDKMAFGLLMKASGIPTLDRQLLDAYTKTLPYEGPYILKPRFGGSSIGIDVVADVDTAVSRLSSNVHFKSGAVVEPYRRDLYDVQIAVKSYPSIQLSAIERPLRLNSDNEILSYTDKYIPGQGMVGASRELPAKLDQKISDMINEITLQAASILGVRGVSRFDFLVGESEVYLNEVNTIPGSLSRYLFIDPKIEFIDLLKDMMDESRYNPLQNYSLQGADGSALKNASSIAAKLI